MQKTNINTMMCTLDNSLLQLTQREYCHSGNRVNVFIRFIFHQRHQEISYSDVNLLLSDHVTNTQ
jgi:hypothetical protein